MTSAESISQHNNNGFLREKKGIYIYTCWVCERRAFDKHSHAGSRAMAAPKRNQS